jgi:hypothetical protein
LCSPSYERGYDRRRRQRSRSSSFRGGERRAVRERYGGRPDDSKERQMREGRCFNCQKRGHIKVHCPELRQYERRGDSRGFRGESRGDYGGNHRDYGRKYSSRSRSPPRNRSRERAGNEEGFRRRSNSRGGNSYNNRERSFER